MIWRSCFSKTWLVIGLMAGAAAGAVLAGDGAARAELGGGIAVEARDVPARMRVAQSTLPGRKKAATTSDTPGAPEVNAGEAEPADAEVPDTDADDGAAAASDAPAAAEIPGDAAADAGADKATAEKKTPPAEAAPAPDQATNAAPETAGETPAPAEKAEKAEKAEDAAAPGGTDAAAEAPAAPEAPAANAAKAPAAAEAPAADADAADDSAGSSDTAEDATKEADEPKAAAKTPGTTGDGDGGSAAPQTEPVATATAPNIPEPEDPVAKAAFEALDKNCARCHQVGQLGGKRQRPAKNFGNVLALNDLAKDPQLILAGNPEGSRLFNMVAKQEMPYDCYQEFDCDAEPSEADVKALYDWITQLGSAKCSRTPVTTQQIVETIARDIDAQPDHRRKGMRYITLTHMWNACVDAKDMDRYRQGVVKLLNSLSYESDVLHMRTIDENRTVVAFNLDDLKWSDNDWDLVIKDYPYAIKPDSTGYDTVRSTTNTPVAWVRGDWFAFVAARPPLYYALLKLPDTFQKFEKLIDIDVLDDIDNDRVARAGFQNSGVSKHNRLIERHSIGTGYFWTSYDFGGDKPIQSLFTHPLGPRSKVGSSFHHDGGETIFSLPNGFQGYYLNTDEGTRLDKGPVRIVLDPDQKDQSVTNGISCMGCHNQGIRKKTDEIRAHVLADRTFPKDVRDKVSAIYPTVEDMNRILDDDFNRFNAAMKRAGLSPELDARTIGVESINYLSKYYENSIDLRVAAAEYGITEDQLSQGLTSAGGEQGRVRRRLEQGVLPRENFEARFTEFVSDVSDDEKIALDGVDVAHAIAVATASDAKNSSDIHLALTSDKTSYSKDDLAVFTVTSDTACHLTLINVDSKGDGTVLFPNKFQKDNALSANRAFRFPSDDANFQFRLGDKGTETVIAVCDTSGKSRGITHNFATRAFTPLGNRRDFVTRQIVIEAKKKVAEARTKGKQAANENAAARTAIKFSVN